jgi:hypothetical protein
MKETEAELAALQVLLDRSHAGASEHLLSIIDDPRSLSARRSRADDGYARGELRDGHRSR